MIDVETIRFIRVLNELAERTKIGFAPLSEIMSNTNNALDRGACVVCDVEEMPIVFDDRKGLKYGRIVSEFADISYYDDKFTGVTFSIDDDDGEGRYYIRINVSESSEQLTPKLTILIDEGRWYIV